MPRRNSRPPPPPYLNEDVVGQLMQHLSRPQRMQLALVCRAWARAAAKTTAAAGVVVHGTRGPALRSVSAWLRNWGFLQLRSLMLHAEWAEPLYHLRVPYSSLAALTSLDLRALEVSLVPQQQTGPDTHNNAPSEQQQQQSWRQAGRVLSGGSTTGLTGLRQLRLSSCQLTSQDYEMLTGPASAPGRLTSLALHLPRTSHWRESGSVWNAGLSGALQHVTAVVDLQVCGDHWSSVVGCLDSFKQLQRLAFVKDDGGDGGRPQPSTLTPYVPLPASMAGLTELVVCNVSAYSTELFSLRPALLQALPQQQLPQLQRLELDDDMFLAPSLLRLSCPNLVQLVLRYDVKYRVDDVGDQPIEDQHDPRLLLPSIASLQQLQHLELALTPGHFPDHFPHNPHRLAAHGVTLGTLPLMLASRQLTELRVSVIHFTCEPKHILPAPGDPRVPSEVAQRSTSLLKLSLMCYANEPYGLCCIPQQCPALQELVLHVAEGPGADATAKDLTGLTGLASTLTALNLYTCTEPDLASVAALSSLRALGLHLQGSFGYLSKSSLRQLTALQDLQELSLYTGRFVGQGAPADAQTVFCADPTAEPASMRGPVNQMLQWADSLPGEHITHQTHWTAD